MSDSGCHLLDDGKPCEYPEKRARGACSGLTYSKEKGFVQEEVCPYYWMWDGTENLEEADEVR